MRYRAPLPVAHWRSTRSTRRRVFGAGAEQLRRWFAGRAVVIGNNRGGRDRWTHPDGRRIEGAFGHAAGIDAILRSESVRLPRPWHVLTMLFLGAALGTVIAALLVAVAALKRI